MRKAPAPVSRLGSRGAYILLFSAVRILQERRCLSGKSVPCITKIGLDELCDGEYETPENCSIVAQKKDDGTEWQRYHGRLIDIPELGKQIIVDPYVYIPYTTDEDGNCTGIGYPTAPDFVVRVDLEFTETWGEEILQLSDFAFLF